MKASNSYAVMLLFFAWSIYSLALPPQGILQSIENAEVTGSGNDLVLHRKDLHAPMQILFSRSQGLGIQREKDQWWVLPKAAAGAHIEANTSMWVLPVDAASQDHAWYLQFKGASANATQTDSGLRVSLDTDSVTASRFEPRPHSDPFGHRFSFSFPGSPALEDALAGFYWGTMLPSVVEKTLAAPFPYHDGYVLSTLNVKAYAGSYPAVDHEFQIKGRLAMASPADLDIVRRMIALQFQLMNDDPERLYRAPTSVQPDGRREYHVRRNSKNNRQNAAMFPLTGDIEVIEEAWNYYAATKDSAWLQANIDNLEHAAGWILANTDQYGRVWSDVYYEDQVMKDGRETEAQGFAAHNFDLLARMETLLHRQEQANRYSTNSRQMAGALVAPLPLGYWDDAHRRFVDWIDRDGKVHDHIHLLANELPVLFGYASAAQADAVRRVVHDNGAEFERFPSFLSADIAAYDNNEIGDGGPYDLCAAGRYWYWDAAYRAAQHDNDLLHRQLLTVAAEAAKNGYFMDERYDMDYVYYIDGKNAHGAEKYYEYPNVFAAVLLSQFLGLSRTADADVAVRPHLDTPGSVDIGFPAYALRYTWDDRGFVLKNLSNQRRRFQVDLSALDPSVKQYTLKSREGARTVGLQAFVVLAPNEEAVWTLARSDPGPLHP